VRRLAPERLVVIAGVAVMCATVGPEVSGTLMVAGVALMLVVMQVITMRRFERREAELNAGSDGEPS
jgi:hypothetical protein